MYNTTTIPTTQLDGSFLGFFYVLSMGAIVGASLIELFLFRLRVRLREKGGAYIDDDSEEEVEEETEDYCNNYQDEFDALSLRKLSEEELKQLNTKIVREQVAEEVEVIMTFDKATETFWYYTDKLKEVSYPILETVARKFAIENDCKIICLQAQAEQAQAEQAPTPIQALSEALTETPEQAEESTQAEQTQAPSVFAKFKSYNAGKGSAPNFTSVVEVIEQMNHFRYRGKIVDYEERARVKVEEPTLDYASYKKLLEEKKEN
jgi:hypothetical protein